MFFNSFSIESLLKFDKQAKSIFISFKFLFSFTSSDSLTEAFPSRKKHKIKKNRTSTSSRAKIKTKKLKKLNKK